MRWTAIVALALVTACGGPLKYKVASSAKAPGADATIVAAIDKAQNTTAVEVEATNLAPAARVVPGTVGYVVWFRRNSNSPWQRLGTLAYEEGDRRGRLKVSAPETRFEVEISCERELSPASPSPEIVFAQAIGE